MGYDLIDTDYSPQSLARSSSNTSASEVEDMNFSEFDFDTKNDNYQTANRVGKGDSQDSYGMFPANCLTTIDNQAACDYENDDCKVSTRTRLNRVYRSAVGRPPKSNSYDSSGYSPSSSSSRSNRQINIYQSPPIESPSKPVPYRGGRKKEEPPAVMTCEERKKWDKERVKKDNHNKIEKRRRYKINDCIGIIGRMLPPYEYDQLNKKGAILQTAIEYIKMLQNSEAIKNKVSQENKRLKEANQSLQMQLEDLKKETILPISQNHLIMTPDQLQHFINKSTQHNLQSNLIKKETHSRDMHDYQQQSLPQTLLSYNTIANNMYNVDHHLKNNRSYSSNDFNIQNNFYKNQYMAHNELDAQPLLQQLNQAPPYEPIDMQDTALSDDFSALSSVFSSSTSSENICGIDDLDLSFFANFSETSLCNTSDEISS